MRKLFGLVGIVLMFGCTPEIGSKEWCESLKKQPKGDWTANQVSDFAKHCLF